MTDVVQIDRDALARAVALDPRYYVDPLWTDVERRSIFTRSWQLVGRAAQLAGTGDHIVDEIAGQPIIIVRQPDGALKGFNNVCRHRAGPLALCNGRGATRLRCRYHGWTYALDGRLRAAPEMQEALDFDPAALTLAGIEVREWQGLVFAGLSPDTTPFDAVFSGIAQRIAPIDIAQMQFDRRISYEVACNWKVYVDNFLEGYHVPHIHPALSDVVDYGHYEVDLADWHSLQHSPVRNNDGIYGDGAAYYYFIWPNTMLNIVTGRLQTNRVEPIAIDRCRVHFDYYYTPEARHRAAADQSFTEQTQLEDAAVCEHVQKALTAGGYAPGRLCPRREAAVWHFQTLLRRAYSGAA